MIDQDIQDGIKAARDYAECLPAKLAVLHMTSGYASVEEVQKELRLVYRMGTELRRQVDHLGQVLENRERT